MNVAAIESTGLPGQALIGWHNLRVDASAAGSGPARERSVPLERPREAPPRAARTATESPPLSADGVPLYRIGAARLLGSRGVDAYVAVAELRAPQLQMLDLRA